MFDTEVGIQSLSGLIMTNYGVRNASWLLPGNIAGTGRR